MVIRSDAFSLESHHPINSNSLFMAPAFAGDPQGGYSSEVQAKIDKMKKELKKHTDARGTADKATYMKQIGIGN